MKQRLVLVSGACGSGKSELRTSALTTHVPAFGETACIETDWVYTMADPTFDRSWPRAERYVALAREQCALLAGSFFDAGFQTVLVVGNSLHQRDSLHPFLGLARGVEVSHVTLDPSHEALVRRMAARGDPDKTPEWLQAHLDYMRPHYEGWTFTIDNSDMTPEQTLDAVVGVVASGKATLVE